MATMAASVLTTGLIGLPDIPNLDAYVPWLLLLTAAGLLATAAIAWRVYRRDDPDSASVWWCVRLIRFYVAFWCRGRRVGHCTVPRQGPVLIAANHTAGVDPLVIIGTCPGRVPSFLVEQEYYRRPIAGWLMRLNRCIPIDRRSPGKSSLAAALQLLREGGRLGIFPQGTYAAPGEPEAQARSGVGALALRSGATVIPVHISGTRYDQHPLRSLLRRHDVRIRYGPPVDLAALRAAGDARDADERAAAQIMSAIRSLAPAGGGS
jgi:1-acyl-sn-glycerol-3-phosphate acyltransferase